MVREVLCIESMGKSVQKKRDSKSDEVDRSTPALREVKVSVK